MQYHYIIIVEYALHTLHMFNFKVQSTNSSGDVKFDSSIEKSLPTLPYAFESHGPNVVVS